MYLAQNGFAESRQKAKGLLEDGLITVNDKPVCKSSYDVKESDIVKVIGKGLAYVGRGGLKLEGALQQFRIDPKGHVCADIGASTGGFTDCLLQNGAKKVYAIDSGTDQLHPKLKNDPRVISKENCNARDLDEKVISEPITLAVMDLSFISQTCVYPALVRILAPSATVITLIKPQFEAGRKFVGKNGLVKDKKIHMTVLENIIMTAADKGLICQDLCVSPITGGDGNIEYLGYFAFLPDSDAKEIVIPGHHQIHEVVFGEDK